MTVVVEEFKAIAGAGLGFGAAVSAPPQLLDGEGAGVLEGSTDGFAAGADEGAEDLAEAGGLGGVRGTGVAGGRAAADVLTVSLGFGAVGADDLV